MPKDEGFRPLSHAQLLVQVADQPWWLDAPNILAVPKALLVQPLGRWHAQDGLRVESAIGFMLRGY